MPDIVTRVWNGIKRYFRFLNATVRLLAPILGILSFFGVGSLVAGIFGAQSALIVTGVGLLLSVALIGFVFYSVVPHIRADYDLKITSKRVYYEYGVDYQTMKFAKYHTVVALKDGVAEFRDRYRWTGEGTVVVTLDNADGMRLVQTKREYWNRNNVLFDRPMKKGEKKEIVLRWELFDANKQAVPFLSQPVDYPTDLLVLSVILPIRPSTPSGLDLLVGSN